MTVSPKTLGGRARASDILVLLTAGKLSLFEAEHALWRVINDLTDNYDEGYNHGYRAGEEDATRRAEQ
jgi:hypothetical protein